MKPYLPVLVAVLLLTASCLQAQNEPKPEKAKASPIKFELATDKKVYRPTDGMTFTLKTINTSKEVAKMRFSSGQTYDIEIRKGKDGKGEKVWAWADGRMFTLSVISQTLSGNSSTSTNVKYVPGDKSNPRKPAPTLTPGEYTITATLTLMGKEKRPTSMQRVTIK